MAIAFSNSMRSHFSLFSMVGAMAVEHIPRGILLNLYLVTSNETYI